MEFSDGLLSQEVGVKKLKEKWAAEAAAKAAKAKAAPDSASRPATSSMLSRPDAPAAPSCPAQSTRCSSSSPSPAQSTRCSSSSSSSSDSASASRAAPGHVHSRSQSIPGKSGLPVTPGAHWRPPANASARFIRPQQPFAPVSREYQPIPSTPMPYGPGCPGTPPLSLEVRNESTKSSSATVEALGVLLFDYYYYNNIKKGLGFRGRPRDDEDGR